MPSVDIPITSVFLALYVIGAIGHMTILQINMRRGHKFLMSGALFGFCMSRIVTSAMRLGVITHPTNVSLNIAANIFLSAGVLIAYVIALLLAQRLLRALQPHLGWSTAMRVLFRLLYISLAICLALVISFTVLTFYTLDTTLRSDALWIQRAAILFLLCFNLVAFVIYLAAVFLPKHSQAEDFGKSGSMATRKLITGVMIALCILEAGFRAGITWEAPRPINNPAWYQSKPAFYMFFFGVEIIIIYTLLLTRFDQRFWVPNGSKQPGHYSRKEAVKFDLDDLEGTLPTTGAR